MKKINLNGFTILCFSLFSLSACSMKDRTEVHSVSVQLPKVWANSSTMSISNNTNSSYLAPTSLASFQCYGLNVTGPGIQADSRMGCTNPNSGMGMIAGFVPVSSGRIEMMVPAGAARTVQLVGIQSSIGCPILDALLNSGGVNALEDLGSPYILGSSTVDIFDDAAVTIYASFNSNTAPAFNGCGPTNGGNNNGPQLLFQTPGDLNLIQAGYCSPIKLEGRNPSNSNSLSVTPTVVTAAATGTTMFSISSGCSSSISSPLPMSTPSLSNPGYSGSVYVKSTGALGETFSANITTSAAGWTNSSPVTYTLVSDRISASGPSSTQVTNTCAPLSLVNYSSPNNTGGSFGDLVIKVRNNSNTASALKVYATNSDCNNNAAELTAVVLSGEKTYTLLATNHTTLTTAGFSVFVKNPSPEHVSISFSKLNATAQPGGVDISYKPFDTGFISGLQGLRTSTHALTIPINSFDPASSITGMMLGSTVCESFVNNTTNVTCTVPTNANPEIVPVRLVVSGANAGIYPTDYNGVPNLYEFGDVPSVIAGQTINVIRGSYTSAPVVTNSTQSPNCTGSLVAGLYWNSACMISGTPTTEGTSNVAVTANNSFGTGYSEFVMINVISMPPTFNMPPYLCSSGIGCSVVSSTSYSITNTFYVNISTNMSGALPTGCTITSGSLPTGMNINSDCSIYGVPNDTPGTFSVTIQPVNSYYSPAAQNISFVLN